LTTEVRNNRRDPDGGPTPLEWQFRMAAAVLAGTLARLRPA
jgi:hypothetical protein